MNRLYRLASLLPWLAAALLVASEASAQTLAFDREGELLAGGDGSKVLLTGSIPCRQGVISTIYRQIFQSSARAEAFTEDEVFCTQDGPQSFNIELIAEFFPFKKGKAHVTATAFASSGCDSCPELSTGRDVRLVE